MPHYMFNLQKLYLPQMDPHYQSQGIQFASLCPAFSATNMLTEAIHGDAGGRQTILYPDMAKANVEKLGICR
ncbi:hypothetical protein CHS0354_034107 [Potamilus streckersoni]|uniref:Uncharacterized protein n=1 Tax=Potamilus streckersoni TaxID=2493646 RepID=A0AAE0TDU8_9BIVA|nr:hypothetical protein CHS0354_034107 [Potamilus streckersoni]